jgi:AraC family transcriptional regulator
MSATILQHAGSSRAFGGPDAGAGACPSSLPLSRGGPGLSGLSAHAQASRVSPGFGVKLPATRHHVQELATGRIRSANQNPLLLTSFGSPWPDLSLIHYASGPAENVNVATLGHTIVVQLTAPSAAREVATGDERLRSIQVQAGHVTVLPAMSPHSVRTADTGEFVALKLRPEFVLCAASELLDGRPLELVLRRGCDDLFLRAGALALKAEVESAYAGGRLYGESVGTALAVHLVRHYSARPPAARSTGGGLTPFQLRQVIDFTQAHLAEDISLASLAGVAGLSPFHFARLFKKSTGQTPHQFLIQRRLERARELLQVKHASIVDVAMQVGFCDQSHLAAHFKRVYGLTPRAFLRRKV